MILMCSCVACVVASRQLIASNSGSPLYSVVPDGTYCSSYQLTGFTETKTSRNDSWTEDQTGDFTLKLSSLVII